MKHVTLVLSILISTLTYGQNLLEIEPKVFDAVNYTKAEQVYWEKAMDLIQKKLSRTESVRLNSIKKELLFDNSV